MSDYQVEQERKRKAEEERLRRLAEEERERKLAEAEKAEKAGDVTGMEYAFTEAEVMDNMSKTISIQKPQMKVEGVSQTVGWRIKSINLDALPCEFSGMVIRPADEKAIMNLIKVSKGKIKIPGVEYEEMVNISVRAS